MTFRFKHTTQYTIGLSVLINLGLTFLFFLTSSDKGVNYLFNGDLLFMNNLYEDFFINGFGIKGWNFPGGQFFFPDMLLFFIIRSIVENVGLSFIIYVMFQQLLILVGIILLFKVLIAEKREVITCISILMFSFIPGIALIDGDHTFPFYLHTINFHVGAFLTSLFYYFLAFQFLQNKKISILLWLTLLQFLGMLSDKIFVIMGPGPLLVGLVFLYRKFERLIILQLFVSLAIGYTLSAISLFLLEKYVIDITKITLYISIERMLYSLSIVIPQTLGFITELNIRSFVILLYPVNIILAIIILTKKKLSPNKMAQLIALATLFFLLIVFWTPILTGIYRYKPMIRYNISVYYFSLIFVVPLAIYARLIKLEHLNYLAFSLVVIFFFVVGKGIVKKEQSLSDFHSYYPSYIIALDSISEKYELKNGLSTYWYSTQIRALSKYNLHVGNVHLHNLECTYFLSNKSWYHTGFSTEEMQIFNFLYIDSPINDDLLIDKFDTIYKYDKVMGMHFYLVPDFTFSNEREVVLLRKKLILFEK